MTDTGMLLLFAELVPDDGSVVDGFTSLDLTMLSIEIRHEQGAFLGLAEPFTMTVLPEMPRTFVIQFEVPVGEVSQIRFLDPVAVAHLPDGDEPISISSGAQTGVKVVRADGSDPWIIEKDKAAGLVMQIDLSNRLIHPRPQGLKLKPTIPAVYFPINADTTPILPGFGTVEFVAGTSDATIDAINSGIGAQIVERGFQRHVVMVRIPHSVSMPGAASHYLGHAEVRAISPLLLASANLTDDPAAGIVIPDDGDPLNRDGDNDPATGNDLAVQFARVDAAWRNVDNDDDGIINGSAGTREIIVAVIDSEFDLSHPDMVLNYYLNNNEIPAAIASTITNTDGLAAVTFADLNDPGNTCTMATGPCPCIVDINPNMATAGVNICDPLDLLNDPRWADGSDQDPNGLVDDLVGYGFGGDSTAESNLAHHSAAAANSHGMAVASIIAAVGDNRTATGTNAGLVSFGNATGNTGVPGVAWAVRLLPISTRGTTIRFDSTRITEGFVDFDFREAIDYAVAQGAHVISMSADTVIVTDTAPFAALGANCPKFTQGSLGSVPGSGRDHDKTMTQVRNYWSGVSLGNAVFVGGPGNCAADLSPDSITSVPHELLPVAQTVIVTATANNMATLQNYAPFGAVIELAGPTDIPALRTGSQTRTQRFNGTSAVAPLVSGTIALFLDASIIDNPNYLTMTTGAQIKQQFLGRTSTTLSVGTVGTGSNNFLDAGRATNLP